MNPLHDTSIQSLPAAAVAALQNRVKGRLVFPGDPSYDGVRQIWNAMIDRRPAVIVRCADADDVSLAVAQARENRLEISIRGGGHNIAGSAVCDNGMMIDFAQMKKVTVDPQKQRAYVEPGATLADFDKAAQTHGLATPVGINSTTGIAGLTLGGGFGWLTRKYGMTIDNLLSVDMVMADGSRIHAAENENADLFWAVRGGGGNFGVVTRFEFRLHAVGPEITAGLIVFPMEQAGTVLRQYREFVESAPEEFNAWAILRQAPPLPFLPETVHGKNVIVLAVFHAGESKTGERLINSLRAFGTAYGEHIGALPYVDWQQAFDPLLTSGARNYWKSHNFTALNDGAIDTALEFAGRLPSPQCEIFVGLVTGAANRVASDATAYAHRDARFVMNVHGRWEDAALDEAGIAWARAFFEASAPYASAGAYVNFMTADEGERVAAAYGANYARLSQIKRKYDPTNLFSGSISIRPE
jgi:FAD/FMN-containing dehydrogenase